MSVFIKAALAAGLSFAAATGTLLGVGQVFGGAEPAPAQAADPAGGESGPDPLSQDDRENVALSRYDRFRGPVEDDLADPANAACGLSKSLSEGGVTMRLGADPATRFSVLSADEREDGEDGVLDSYSASIEGMHAFEERGDLVVQAGYTNPQGFRGRFWFLDADGYPNLSDPLVSRGRVAISCDDPVSAADLLNRVFWEASTALGDPVHDPVRSGARALTNTQGVAVRSQPNVEAFMNACTPEQVLTAMPAGERFVLDAVFDARGAYGEQMTRSNSSERIAGIAQPMVYFTLVEINDRLGSATVEELHLPLEWHNMGGSDDVVWVQIRWRATEVFQWTIAQDGSRSPRTRVGTLDWVRFPCADPEAGAEALEAIHDGYWDRR